MPVCVLCVTSRESLNALSKTSMSPFRDKIDGSCQAHGLYIIALTDRLGRLEPAQLPRPSRFDTTYVFDVVNENQCALGA